MIQSREYQATVRRALRNARRQNRSLQTASEKLERRLDRMIDQKTYYNTKQTNAIVVEFNFIKASGDGLTKALADAISSINV